MTSHVTLKASRGGAWFNQSAGSLRVSVSLRAVFMLQLRGSLPVLRFFLLSLCSSKQFVARGAPCMIQTQEHANVTLTWRFPLEADAPLALLHIDIWSGKLVRSVYRYNNRHQPVPYQDRLYGGRVRCDLELAQLGRIECVFSGLRLNDTDNYTCIAVFDKKSHVGETCNLRVTAHDDDDLKTKVHLDPQSLPNPEEEAETAGRLYLGARVSGAVLVLLVLLVLGGAVAAAARKRLRDHRLDCDDATTKPLQV